jgi:hypothetical protein
MNRQQMLTALLRSRNKMCVAIAERVLADLSVLEHEKKYTGHFMTAVLDDDFPEAVRNADQLNVVALAKHCKDQDPTHPDNQVLSDRMKSLGILEIPIWA